MSQRYEDFVSIGPGSLAGKFLRQFWQPVCQAADLKPGRPLPRRILGEDITLYRGDSGKIYAVGPRCPHRGLQLSAARVKGETLECFYHGWTFDGAGQCVAQPCEPQSFAQKVRIPSYHAREYIGLIFVYFGEGAPAEFPTLDSFSADGFVELREDLLPWSYFTQLENSIDEAHFNFTHRRSKFDDIGMNDAYPVITCEETDYGVIRWGKRGNAVRTGHFFMPNSSLSSVYEHDKGWADLWLWRVPVDDNAHRTFVANFIYKTGAEAEAYRKKRAGDLARLKTMEPQLQVVRKIINGEMTADEVPADRPDIVQLQDAISCWGQGTERNRNDDMLGASDRVVSVVRRLWTRELRALDEGRPTKAWRIPPDLATTKGVG
jgi:5,5'-dehydrodivanillate O-demethylase